MNTDTCFLGLSLLKVEMLRSYGKSALRSERMWGKLLDIHEESLNGMSSKQSLAATFLHTLY